MHQPTYTEATHTITADPHYGPTETYHSQCLIKLLHYPLHSLVIMALSVLLDQFSELVQSVSVRGSQLIQLTEGLVENIAC